jgi:hypothetical protein
MPQLTTDAVITDINGNEANYTEDELMTTGHVMRMALDQFTEDSGGVYKLFQIMQTLDTEENPEFDDADLDQIEKAVTNMQGLGNFAKGQVLEEIKDARDA